MRGGSTASERGIRDKALSAATAHAGQPFNIYDASAAFIECCVRSPHYKAVDVMAAASYLPVLCCFSWPLSSAAASAIASLVKKAAACVTASGNAHAASPLVRGSKCC
jgi:hypothetical protein